ncbi:aspartyl/glutamyl-tRNA amidotransferase subunit C [Candidatus Parcubacteria bacterium]|jgi:aspartyl/glutamyl-tRNA(Asn/Gln) amidotransferase C subunit|nr:MAG: aspartyl/glutamyl-tRNA amidotransferase subunit C [Candidatus Parcubacteria bacterium]
MQLNEKDIAHLAKLARLHLDATTQKRFAEQLTRVIEYVEIISQEKIPAQAEYESGAVDPLNFRPDEKKDFKAEELKNLPAKKSGDYIVSPPLT